MPTAGSDGQVREPVSPVRGRGVPGQTLRQRSTTVVVRHLVAYLPLGWSGKREKTFRLLRLRLPEPSLPHRRSSFHLMTRRLNLRMTWLLLVERRRMKPVHTDTSATAVNMIMIGNKKTL